MTENPTIQRLENQIDWYNRKSNSHQRWFRLLKIAEIIIAAFIPFLAGKCNLSILVGMAGVLIVILEGLQHLFQFQHNWIIYRSTCENLKHEKYLWLAKSGPYQNVENPDAVLADRIESLVSQEHSKWIAGQDRSAQSKKYEV